jgi:hypothetical protein
MSRRKKRPGRRQLEPVQRRDTEAPTAPEPRLRRAASTASTLGVVALLSALAIQYKILPADLGPNGPLVLKVLGGALIIAGFILGRGTKR